ncbi:MAG: 30S ribosomal protein S3, partial [Verrucomicrobia bacterium]|nr:30S ribosomal protein S3 [Verrucomicrobiota bacterium]
MGQKVNPIGLRIAVNKNWRSRWFAGKKEFSDLLQEDIHIREVVQKRLKDAALSNVFIERYANRVRVTIRTARPGLVIGRKGEDIERLREQLGAMTKKEVYIEIDEVKKPDLDAKLVAENIALQLERRVSFRRAMKRAIQTALKAGAEGVRVQASGRLGGSDMGRREWYREGRVPLHTLRA